jgi:hypothetical protein
MPTTGHASPLFLRISTNPRQPADISAFDLQAPLQTTVARTSATNCQRLFCPLRTLRTATMIQPPKSHMILDPLKAKGNILMTVFHFNTAAGVRTIASNWGCNPGCARAFPLDIYDVRAISSKRKPRQVYTSARSDITPALR